MTDHEDELLRAAALKAAGRHRAAIGLCESIIAAEPDNFEAHAIKMECLQYAADSTIEEIDAALRFWETLNPPERPYTHDAGNRGESKEKLRIGYLALDFRANPATLGTLPALHFHDRNRFRIHGYADLSAPDGATEQFLAQCDSHRDLAGLSATESARAIHEDGIDILVILAVHAARWLVALARHRPAPVQIAWHNNCSIGIPEIDYWLGDPVSTPANGPERFVERVVRLPCWTIQAIPFETPETGPLPAETNGRITFGSFNNPIKITSRVIDLWSRVLAAVPESRLFLKFYGAYGNDELVARIANGFITNGVDPERVEILQSSENRGEHLAQYNQIDIALDPFPFSGATTMFEALLMGVPVVTLTGDRFVARMSASLLQSIGLQAFCTDTEDAYVACARELASNPAFLAKLRPSIRPMLERSRVHNARRFTRNLERVYRAAWRHWATPATRAG